MEYYFGWNIQISCRSVRPRNRPHLFGWIPCRWRLGVSTLRRHDSKVACLMEQISRIKQRGGIDAKPTANRFDSRKEARGMQRRELNRQSKLTQEGIDPIADLFPVHLRRLGAPIFPWRFGMRSRWRPLHL